MAIAPSGSRVSEKQNNLPKATRQAGGRAQAHTQTITMPYVVLHHNRAVWPNFSSASTGAVKMVPWAGFCVL